MQVSSNMGAVNAAYNSGQDVKKNSLGIKNLYTQKLSIDEVKELKEQIVQNSNAFSFKSVSVQSSFISSDDKFEKEYQEFQSFLKDIGYEGSKSISKLSQQEAAKLVSEDGFFGVSQTAERIANFVIDGADGDEDFLRAGREGMIKGFEMAQDMWGEELPEISQLTMSKALEKVDTAISGLGFSILDQEV